MTGSVVTGVVVVAAGAGTRLGAGLPKAFVEIDGRSLLEHALSPLAGIGPAHVVVTAPAARLDEAGRIARRVLGSASHLGWSVVAGGAERQDSVLAALDSLPDSCDVVLVHDAARAFAPASVFVAVAGAVRESGAGVVPALRVVDTIKRVEQDAAGRARIVETVDRDALRAVQTPQGFPAAAYREACARAVRAGGASAFTDDAALYASTGGEVVVIDGSAEAFKITVPADLERAGELVPRSASAASPSDAGAPDARAGAVDDRAPAIGAPTGPTPELRTGIGSDVHAFDDESELWLAGLHWPGERGLSGHSDGDAVSHAIVDALLAAAGLGDIGLLVGTDDPRFAGAHGEVFLRAAHDRIRAEGWRVVNVAVQIVGNRPKVGPRRGEAERALSAALDGAPVSVSATTTDGLGALGRGEGVQALATALVAR